MHSVGEVCAFISGGQIVTDVCASIAGSIVGGVGFISLLKQHKYKTFQLQTTM